MIGGLTGIGKTFLLMELAGAFMLGAAPFSIPSWTAKKARVLYIDKELGPYMFADRLKARFSAEELDNFGSNLLVMAKPKGMQLSNPEVMTWLRDYCAGEGIDVLMLDPISRFHYWDENAGGGAQVVEAIETIADGHVATIVTHHFRKPAQGRDAEHYDSLSQYNFRGSVGTKLVEDASFSLTLAMKDVQTAPFKRWKLSTRLEKTRNTGADLSDFNLLVNWNNDRRVTFEPKGGDHRIVTPIEGPKRPYRFPG